MDCGGEFVCPGCSECTPDPDFRSCEECSERAHESEMVRDDVDPGVWLCKPCSEVAA